MKIRTKLVLLLCGALSVTEVASAVLQQRLTRELLEQRARDRASESADEIASDLQEHIKPDSDADEISERLKFEERSHRSVATIEFSFDPDEDTTVSYNLDFNNEEPKIQSTARPAKKRASLRREDVRRALLDHGQLSRWPGDRTIEPMWRTPERPDSPAWARLGVRPPPSAKRPTPRAFLVDLRDPSQKQDQRYVQVAVDVKLEGGHHGQLRLRSSLEGVDRLMSTQRAVSALVTGSGVLLLIFVTMLIAGRIVGRPVEELEGAMHAVERGDLARRVRERGTDEVGKLGRGFNAMIARLAEADEEIRAFNRRLADEVRAATADLEHKNEALEHLNRLLLETQKELSNKERLAVLGQLAAQLAHEIGTPLGSVSGHLQLAMSARDVPPALKERLRVATRELERVSKIVRDYLDSTRPVKPSLVSCDVARLLGDAVGIAMGAGERRGLRIETHVEPDASRIDSDPGLLRQVLINLINNACDAVVARDPHLAQAPPSLQSATTGALPPSSPVGSVESPGGRGHIAVSARLVDGAVEIAVKDDGVGLGSDDRARIFEPFYTTKGRGKGTGLGLSICRELTHALGGRIAVDSVPGEGSTFTVRLPLSGVPLSSTSGASGLHRLPARAGSN